MLAIRRLGDEREIDIKPSAERYLGEPAFYPKRHVFRLRVKKQDGERVADDVLYVHNGERQTLDRQTALEQIASLISQTPDAIRLNGKTIFTRSGKAAKGERQDRLVVLLTFKNFNRRVPVSYPVKVKAKA